jgi:hypothetical protein
MEPTRQSRVIALMQCPICGRVVREERHTMTTCRCEAVLLFVDGKVSVLTAREADSVRIAALLYGPDGHG